MKVTTTMTHSSSIIIIANVPPRQMTTNQQQPTNWNVSTLHARAGIPRNRDMLLRSWSAAISRIKAALAQAALRHSAQLMSWSNSDNDRWRGRFGCLYVSLGSWRTHPVNRTVEHCDVWKGLMTHAPRCPLWPIRSNDVFKKHTFVRSEYHQVPGWGAMIETDEYLGNTFRVVYSNLIAIIRIICQILYGLFHHVNLRW